MACPFLFIILQEKGKIKLHLGYKSGISFSKVASRIQKLHFVYKYSVVTLQSGVSAYKVASRFSIKLCHERNIIYLRKNRTYLYKIPADISAAVI